MSHTAREIELPVDGDLLPGFLDLPAGTGGLVLFVHGSGSSRFSPRNQAVADALNRAGIGTLLFDLLTTKESEVDAFVTGHHFNTPMQPERVVRILDWICQYPPTSGLRLGLFGASTGATGALAAAAARPDQVRAVVSRGGRLDVAAKVLGALRLPTLFIVGSRDRAVLEVNREAAMRMPVAPRIELIPGAGHLFEERGKLEQVAALTRTWFLEHLAEAPRAGVSTVSPGVDARPSRQAGTSHLA